MKARAQGPLSLRSCSLRTRVPIRSRCPGTTSLDKRLRVITRGADDTCTLTVQIGYISTVWPRFLAGILAARLASWYHLAWSSLLLPCQANRPTARVPKHIVTREIRDNKIRELARVYLSRAVTTRWIPGALAPARSSCRRCSSNCRDCDLLSLSLTERVGGAAMLRSARSGLRATVVAQS